MTDFVIIQTNVSFVNSIAQNPLYFSACDNIIFFNYFLGASVLFGSQKEPGTSAIVSQFYFIIYFQTSRIQCASKSVTLPGVLLLQTFLS